MTTPDERHWLLRIEGGLSAHFVQPDGSNRPGTDWTVGLKRGDSTCTVLVRAYLSDDMTERARNDTQYQGETVLGYVSDWPDQGCMPQQGGNLVITIQNPTGESADGPRKPW